MSVVVPSVNGLGDLIGCLQALENERKTTELEVLVVDRCGQQVREKVRQNFPDAIIIEVERSVTIPQMRARAFQVAKGSAVAVIEDHVIVPPGWAKAMLSALSETTPIVGGSVENAATQRWVDWAAFLCEYSHCILPIPEGSVEWLTGNNVIYRRELLDRFREAIEAGKWENHLHEAIRKAGIPLTCRPEICVGHKKHYTFAEYLSQRYLYARSYAGARMAGESFAKRIAVGCAAFALPPILFYRTVSRILQRKRHRKELFISLPAIGLFVCAWALGEIAGYWMGPGDSLSKVC